MSRSLTLDRPIAQRLAESGRRSGRTAAEPERFDTWLAEQRQRAWMSVRQVPLDALVVEDVSGTDRESDRCRWVASYQVADLVRHSHSLDVQARSLVACLYSMTSL